MYSITSLHSYSTFLEPLHHEPDTAVVDAGVVVGSKVIPVGKTNITETNT